MFAHLEFDGSITKEKNNKEKPELLLKEEGMLHSVKHGRVPTSVRHVAAIKFKISYISLKMIYVGSIVNKISAFGGFWLLIH